MRVLGYNFASKADAGKTKDKDKKGAPAKEKKATEESKKEGKREQKKEVPKEAKKEVSKEVKKEIKKEVKKEVKKKISKAEFYKAFDNVANLKEFLKKNIENQTIIKEEFESGLPTLPGMSINEYLKKRDSQTYFFSSPIQYTKNKESLGIRIRDSDAKLRYEFPTVYPRKRYLPPNQFRYETPPDSIKEYLTKDSYFEDFVPPYVLESEEFKRCIEEIKEGKSVSKQMIDLLPTLSLKDLSTVPLILSLETPFKDKEFWEKYEKMALEKYPLFPKELMWRMRYAFRKLDTDLLSSSLKHKIYMRGVECIKCTDSVKDILRILKAFQGAVRPNLYFSALSTLITRRDEFLLVDPETKSPTFIANMIYNLGICRPRHLGSMIETAQQNIKEFLAHYEELILDSINKMLPADIVKLLQGMLGLRISDYPNILHRIEKQIVLLKDKLTHNELADVIWGFAHVNNGALWGRDKTFEELEPIFMKKAKLMNHWQVSRCAYTFAARRHNSENLFKYLDKRLHEELPNMKYASLHNVAYYLLMREIKDEQFWKDFVNRTLAIPDVLPLIYYFPFKLCWQYLEGFKPEWDASVFMEKLWWAERLKVAVVLEEEFYKHEEYADFLKVISSLKLDPAISYTWQNTCQVHFAFPEMKVGIMVYLDKDLVPETMRVNESKLVLGRVLRKQGWEILDISYKEFIEMGKKNGLKYLKEWLELASNIQAEIGVAPKHPITGYV